MIIPTILKLKGVVIPLGLVILGAGIAVQPVLTGEISETAVVSDSLSLNGSAGEVQSVSELSSGDSSLTVLEFSSGHSLNASVTSAVPGSPISVAWVAPAGSSRYDWVTIARVGSADDVYGNWKYTYGATSGNFSTAAPSSAGEYEFRYFLNNGFSLAARSQVITISVSATPGPTPTSTPTPSPTPLPSGTPTPTPMPGDSISPEVNIIFPAPGMTVYGITGLSAVAKDNIAVARVEFYINGVFRGYDTMAPFSYGWDTTEGGTAPCIGLRTHTIYAKVYDASGNTAISQNTTVYMNNPGYCPSGTPLPTSTPAPSPTPAPSGTPTPTPIPGDPLAPTVNITFPNADMTVYGVTGLAAVASDNIGVSKVEFYINGVFRGYDTMAPFSYGWDTTEGGTAPCTGLRTHAISAKAFDAAGNTGTSPVVFVKMSNPTYCPSGTPLPTSTPTPSPTPLPSGTPTPTPMPGDSISPEVNIIFPAPGMTVYGITGLSAVAKDNIAVARVEFYINGVFRGYDTMAPFSYGWDTTEGGTAPCTTSNTIYAKAYDTSGNMAQSLSVNVYTSNNYGGNCTSN